ncbi:MAG: CpeT/CpcT family [Candidatus Sumerlaeota bacterium]|nr:CpeT/CpcT family [Candidatus Sumerlaeota bacterium]
MRTGLFLMAMLLLTACGEKALTILPAEPPRDRRPMLEEWLEGTYSNVATAPEGEALELRIARLPDFGHAFYVEEARPGSVDEPLRQYVWMVRPDEEDGYVIEHWRVLDPERRRGAWRSQEKLLEFTMYTLRHAADCDLEVRWTGTQFVASTTSRECAECVPGAERMQTSLVLEPEMMELRLVGLDGRGKTVFGPSAREWSWRGSYDAWRMEKVAE